MHILIFLVGGTKILYLAASLVLVVRKLRRWEPTESRALAATRHGLDIPIHARYMIDLGETRVGRWLLHLKGFLVDRITPTTYLALRSLVVQGLGITVPFDFRDFVTAAIEEEYAVFFKMGRAEWLVTLAWLAVPYSSYAFTSAGVVISVACAVKLNSVTSTLAAHAYTGYRKRASQVALPGALPGAAAPEEKGAGGVPGGRPPGGGPAAAGARGAAPRPQRGLGRASMSRVPEGAGGGGRPGPAAARRVGLAATQVGRPAAPQPARRGIGRSSMSRIPEGVVSGEIRAAAPPVAARGPAAAAPAPGPPPAASPPGEAGPRRMEARAVALSLARGPGAGSVDEGAIGAADVDVDVGPGAGAPPPGPVAEGLEPGVGGSRPRRVRLPAGGRRGRQGSHVDGDWRPPPPREGPAPLRTGSVGWGLDSMDLGQLDVGRLADYAQRIGMCAAGDRGAMESHLQAEIDRAQEERQGQWAAAARAVGATIGRAMGKVGGMTLRARGRGPIVVELSEDGSGPGEGAAAPAGGSDATGRAGSPESDAGVAPCQGDAELPARKLNPLLRLSMGVRQLVPNAERRKEREEEREEVREEHYHALAERSERSVAGREQLFWFGRPALLLWLMKFVFFENSLSIALLLHRAWTGDEVFGFTGSWWGLLLWVVVDIALMVHSSWVVVPLYAVVSRVAASTPLCVVTYLAQNQVSVPDGGTAGRAWGGGGGGAHHGAGSEAGSLSTGLPSPRAPSEFSEGGENRGGAPAERAPLIAGAARPAGPSRTGLARPSPPPGAARKVVARASQKLVDAILPAAAATPGLTRASINILTAAVQASKTQHRGEPGPAGEARPAGASPSRSVRDAEGPPGTAAAPGPGAPAAGPSRNLALVPTAGAVRPGRPRRDRSMIGSSANTPRGGARWDTVAAGGRGRRPSEAGVTAGGRGRRSSEAGTTGGGTSARGPEAGRGSEVGRSLPAPPVVPAAVARGAPAPGQEGPQIPMDLLLSKLGLDGGDEGARGDAEG